MQWIRQQAAVCAAMIAIVLAAGGCAGTETTATLEDGTAVTLPDKEVGLIEGLRNELQRYQDQLATMQTPEQVAETQAMIDALNAKIDAKLDELAEHIGITETQVIQVVDRIMTQWDDPNASTAQLVGGTVQAVSPTLPPPWNLVAIIAGSVIAGGGGMAAGRRAGLSKARAIVQNIARSVASDRDAELVIDKERLRAANKAAGVQQFVRDHKDAA